MHNAARWICQTRVEKCNGVFRVDGKVSPCALAAKCLNPANKASELEFLYERAYSGILIGVTDPQWNTKHATRRNELICAFCHDDWLGYHRNYANAHRAEINARHREKYEPSMGRRLPGYVPANAIKDIPPPCGGDCQNCPFDDGCHYPDWDSTLDKKREAKRRGSKRYASRRKERMKSDPAYAEQERAKSRASTAAHRKKKKALFEQEKKL